MRKLNVGLLSSVGNCFLIPVLRAMENDGTYPSAILLDGEISEKDLQMTMSRMLPDFRPETLADIQLPSDVSVLQTGNHNGPEAQAAIRELGIEFLANAGTPRILKAPLLDLVKGVVNCHPGSLPAYRGCTCVEWSIYNGDPVSATSHFMTAGIDDGPVLLSEILPVAKFEKYESVRTRMMSHQAALLAKSLSLAIDHGYSLANPPAQRKSGADTYYKPIPDDKLQAVKQKLSSGEYESK